MPCIVGCFNFLTTVLQLCVLLFSCRFIVTGEDFWRWQTMNPDGYRADCEKQSSPHTATVNGIATSVIKANTIQTNGHN